MTKPTTAHPVPAGPAHHDTVIAYRVPDEPGVLLCREHGHGHPELTPLTSEDLDAGGICTYSDPAKGGDVCGRDVLIDPPAAPDSPSAAEDADRRERYAVALHDAIEEDLSLNDQEPPVQALYSRQAEAAIALADAETAKLREQYLAGLRRADEINNKLMEEVQRYADGTERPVLWSVYNAMHQRALRAEADRDRWRSGHETAEAQLRHERARVAELEADAGVTPPPALTEEGRLRARVKVLEADAERGQGLTKIGARCMREGHQGLIETGRVVIEGHRFALSTKLALGTGAPWDAIHARVAELSTEGNTLRDRLNEATAKWAGLEQRAAEVEELRARVAELETQAADATEYIVHLPDVGGTELIARRSRAPYTEGWAVSTRALGGGRAWTREGWQEAISALTVDRLFCWPDAQTAIREARQALAGWAADRTAEQPAQHSEERPEDAARRFARRLHAVEQLCSGHPGYHTITVKALLTAMSDADEERP